jgi:predicted transposase YdaD
LSDAARTDALAALLILAGLRSVQPLVREEVHQMALTFDIKNNAFLREVFEEGRQEGQQDGERILLRRQLASRFGPLPEWAEQQLVAADTATLEQWGMRLLEATSLEEVFRTV